MNTKKMSLKSFFAVLMMAMMVLTFVPATSIANAATKDSSITVTGVESGATITGYQILSENSKGQWVVNAKVAEILGLENTSGATEVVVSDPSSVLTAANLSKLGAQANSLGVDTIDLSSGSYSGADTGTYMILVSGTTENVYNIMAASVDYDSSNDTNKVAAKTSPVDVTKKVTGKNTSTTVENSNGTTDAVGDTLTFTITPTIPNYGAEYTNAQYIVSDTLSEGLTLDTASIVVSGATEGSDYSITGTSESGFTVTFTKSFLTNGNAKNVTIKYNATLNDKAVHGFDANTNTAKIKYSTNPSEDSDLKEKEKTTYHYTFDIDGDVQGSKKITGNEVVKVAVDSEGNAIFNTEKKVLSEVSNPLEGAEFTLYSDEACTTVVRTATTNDSGLMKMTGLDAGTYYLKETKAPTGYQLNEQVVKVVITATLNSDGTLASYSIQIGETARTHYTLNNGVATVDTTNNEHNGDIAAFNNVPNSGLPSTGGIGTTIFMIVGALVMAAAAIMYVVNRRKNNNA